MNNLYSWIERNIDRVYRYTFFFATLFVGIALGAVFIYKIYEPKVVYVDNYIEVPSEPVVVVRYATEEEEKQRNMEQIEALAKVVWGEARGCSDTQKAAVVWCILNRVDNDRFPNDIVSVITSPAQFEGYNANNPVEDDIVELVIDVLDRYELEKTAVGDVGRVLPNDYFFFRSSGTGVNVFRQEYKSENLWNWEWGTPYV